MEPGDGSLLIIIALRNVVVSLIKAYISYIKVYGTAVHFVNVQFRRDQYIYQFDRKVLKR